jgi:carboxymethylenebutenolidase
MNIFPRWTCWWSRAAGTTGALGLVAAWLAFAFAVQGPAPKTGRSLFLEEFEAGGAQRVRALPLFLDDFLANTEPSLISREVRFPSAVGPVAGFWARPDVKQPLPAVLIVYDEDSWTDWMKTNTRHLASIGYEVLTVNVHRRRVAASRLRGAGGEGLAFTDEATLAELSAAVRWLRGRSTVLPNRLGVVGWNWSGGQALALASATSLQACIVCDAPLPSEPGIAVGLRGTPVLAVYAGEDQVSRKELSAFRKLLAASQVSCKVHLADGVRAGFMGPSGKKPYAHDAAEDAWVVIYNFLEKHVEDARSPEPASLRIAAHTVATIADIMRAVNEPAGLRGALGKALEREPGSRKEWERIRANAALMAEAGGWLQMQPPPKGPVLHWKEQAQAFTAAAEAIVNAADKRDYPAARRGLTRLASQCAACHLEHR